MAKLHPPVKNAKGNWAPNPQARYLRVEDVLAFSNPLKAVLQEVGGQMLLNRVIHLFQGLDLKIEQQMKEDQAEFEALEKEREDEQVEGGGGDDVTGP